MAKSTSSESFVKQNKCNKLRVLSLGLDGVGAVLGSTGFFPCPIVGFEGSRLEMFRQNCKNTVGSPIKILRDQIIQQNDLIGALAERIGW